MNRELDAVVDEQHEPGERLLAQRTHFAARSFLAPNEMYAQVKQGTATQERARLSVEPLVVEQVRWSVVAPRALRPVSIAICTHNRADYCLDTLTELAEDPDALNAVAAVHVTDQGNDAVESRDRFGAVKEAMGGKLR